MITLISIFERIFEAIASPFFNPVLIWIMFPVYFNLVVNDLYMDKMPDFINFIAGGFTALWVGMDLGRELTSEFTSKSLNLIMSFQGFVSVALILYGFITIVAASRKKEIVKYISRIREITFVLIWLIPLFYGLIPADFLTLVSALIFFPIFYFSIELVDRYVIKSTIG